MKHYHGNNIQLMTERQAKDILREKHLFRLAAANMRGSVVGNMNISLGHRAKVRAHLSITAAP